MGNSNTSNIIPTDKQYPKLSKAASGYLEIDTSSMQTYIPVTFVTIVPILSSPITVQ
ncbi:MAG: hypothetical protein ACJ72F_04735 [Nitrososphaeraceae archaeon]